MANAYRTRGDVTIDRVIAVEGQGDDSNELTESVLYPAGSVVSASNMTKRERERAANGDLDHLLEAVSDEEAEQAAQGRPGDEDYAVFVPEHEAEAHALEVYGHTVVPPEQALELGSASAEYASQYQAAAKEHGLDRRPVQEAFAEERERVPDEVLRGGQHRTGLPFDRGPVEFEGADAEDQHERAVQQNVGGQRVEAEVASAPRQRPGTEAVSPQQGEGESE